MSVSATSNSSTGSPFQIRIPDANASDVNDVAQKNFTLPLSPISARLSNAESEKNLLLKLYLHAHELLETDPIAARASFSNLIREIPKDSANLFFLTNCKIGLAFTYPKDSEKRKKTAHDARPDLYPFFMDRNPLNDVDQHKVHGICGEELFRAEMSSLDYNIESQTEDRTCHIRHLNCFYNQMNKSIVVSVDKEREMITHALRMLVGRNKIDHLLARAFGITSLASTYDPGVDRICLSLIARIQTFTAYERKEELFTNDKSKVAALNLFSQIFEELIRLFPADSYFCKEIEKRLAECEKELALEDKQSDQCVCRLM
jgi:hypothetical protein